MKKILFMFSANAKHFKTTAIWILVLAAMPTFSYGQDDAILTPDSPLLAPVDKSIQDSVIKRIKMDLNPDVEHLRNTAQIIRKDIPPIELSLLEFVPVIAQPQILLRHEGDSLLWVDKEFSFMAGKTKNGKDIFIMAEYKNRNNDVNSLPYRNRSEVLGKEKADETYKKFQNRKGIDHWRISVFPEDSIMFQLMDYARSQSDDGKFFILTKGTHHFEICYFKDGEPLSCRKSTRYDEIRVQKFANLMR